MAVWNSLGLSRYFTGTRAGTNLIALEGLQPGQSTGFAGDFGTAVANLDLKQVARRAIDKALLGRDPIELEPETYDVILEPAAVAELLEWMSFIGLNSKAIEDKTSFLVDRMDQAITGPQITLVDDGIDNPADKVPFDVEGTPKRRTVLIDKGVAKEMVFDRLYGHRSGRSSTGHAVGVGLGTEAGAFPTSLCLEGGTDSRQSLIEKVERGLWITRFHYVNGMLRPKRAVMTGLTRDGTFLIENGRLARGIKNLRFTDSVLEAFERIDGLTVARSTIPNWWTDMGSVTAPTVLIRGLKFTGKTS
jgi:predicted Zn-dependent protease